MRTTHTHTHTKHAYILRYRHNEHTFLHTWRHKHTLRIIIISRSCCHDLFYQRQVKYDCGVNSGGEKRQLWLSHLPAAFILLFSWEDTILISTNRRESQHRLTRNELWAVNVTTIPIMMMIVIKMMIAADSKREKKETTKQLCSRSVVIGQCRPTGRTPWQRLTKTPNIVFIIIIIMVNVILTCLQRLSARYNHP